MRRLILVAVIFCVQRAYGQSPVQINPDELHSYGFIENKGQIRDQYGEVNTSVRYLLSQPGLNVQVRDHGFSYDTYQAHISQPRVSEKSAAYVDPGKSQLNFHRVDISFPNSNPFVTIIAGPRAPDDIRYIGQEQINVSHFSSVLYEDLYEGIDLKLYINEKGGFEYDFIVHPGVAPELIQMNFEGQNKLTQRSENQIALQLIHGELIEEMPYSYLSKTNQPVKVAYKQVSPKLVSVAVEDYDRSQTLVIDPTPNRLWSTYYGGSLEDSGETVSADASGNVYLGGYTFSTNNIATAGAAMATLQGSYDGFFAKFDASGARQFGTYYGGSGDDIFYGILVDGLGNIYATGMSTSSGLATAGTQQSSIGGLKDALLVKFNNSGVRQWATYFGGTADDQAFDITMDGSNNPIIAGRTSSPALTMNGAQATFGGGTHDAFYGSFNASTGVRLISSFIGGSGDDGGVKLIADGSNNVYVVGWTASSSGIATVGAHQTIFAGVYDGFIAKYSGSGLKTWATYYGGSADDEGYGVGIDAASSVYVCGFSTSTTGISTGGAHQFTHGVGGTDGSDGFLAKFSSSGVRQWGTYYGGTGDDVLWSMVETSGSIFVCGETTSTGDIASSPTFQQSVGGLYDAMLAKFDSNGIFGWGTYFGGPGDDYAKYNTIDANGNVIISGITASNSSIASGGHQNSYGGGSYDGFIAKFDNGSSGGLAPEPTAPPTGLVFSNVTDTSFDYDFVHTVGSHSGYVHFRKAGSPPTFVPVDGVTYTSGLDAPDGSYIQYNDDIPSGNSSSGLIPGTTYYYKIYVYNDLGTAASTNYLNSNPLTGNETTTGGSFAVEPTAQPTNLVFSSTTQTSYSYSFTAATGSPAGYIGVRKAGSAPTFVPVDGVTYTAGDQPTAGETINFNGTSTSYNATGAVMQTTYHITIFAYNGSGATINYRQTSPLTNSVTTLGTDDIPPTFGTNNTPSKAAQGSSVKISVQVTDTGGSGLASVTVDYYPINSVNYGSGTLVNISGNTWEFTIPGTSNTLQGVEYNVLAADGAGNTNETQWQQIIVEHVGDGLPITFNGQGELATNYRIVSVPLDLAKKSANDVFGDDLGAYDKTKWRLFRYTGSQNAELSGTSPIELGKGYWLIKKASTSLDTGPGTTANTGIGKPTLIPITAGWNQIGNPFNSDVAWSDILSDADNSALTLGNLRVYEGAWANGTVLKRFSGGFVMVQGGGGNLTVPVLIDARTAEVPAVNFNHSIDSETWAATIRISSGDITNEFAGVGMHPLASEENDRFDDFTLPRFFDYLELNHDKKLYGSHYTKDIVPTQAQYEWSFEVTSNLPDEVIQLKWDNSYFGENDQQLVLWDEAQQLAVNMKADNVYSFSRRDSKLFRIFYGNEKFVKDNARPQSAVFHSVSPIPAENNVTFAFSVPESDGQVRTNLVVYNLLGQRIATLVDEPLPEGYHEALWNIDGGVRPQPGVYISVLKFGSTAAQKRLFIR